MPMARITLTCLIEGESTPFIVKPKKDISIMELKDLIKDKKSNHLRTIDANELTLWKVCYL